MVGHSDMMLTFGTLDLKSGTADFANTIEPKESTLEGFKVAVSFGNVATAAGKVKITLSACEDGGANFSEVSNTGNITDFSKPYYLLIPSHSKKTIFKAAATVTGTFTGGTVKAEVDTYTGV